MDFKGLGKLVGTYAPLLGSLLPIPGAGIAGTLIAKALGCDNTPDAIHSAIKQDPEAAIKLAALENAHSEALQRQVLEAETSRILSVNSTMQAESKSEHWLQWAWRPCNGILFGITLFLVYALPAIKGQGVPVVIPDAAMIAWGSVLGITAWKRGESKPAGGKS